MGYVGESLGTQTIQIGDGMEGVGSTVVVMQQIARSGGASADVREQAERIVRGLRARDWKAEALAVERWVRSHLRYTRDGLQVETLKTTDRMLRDISEHGRFMGDCDDSSILVASLLLALGHEPSFQVLGRGLTPHHVNVLDRTSGLTLDPTGEMRGRWAYRRIYDVAG